LIFTAGSSTLTSGRADSGRVTNTLQSPCHSSSARRRFSSIILKPAVDRFVSLRKPHAIYRGWLRWRSPCGSERYAPASTALGAPAGASNCRFEAESFAPSLSKGFDKISLNGS
jgi:hypothetical protein